MNRFSLQIQANKEKRRIEIYVKDEKHRIVLDSNRTIEPVNQVPKGVSKLFLIKEEDDKGDQYYLLDKNLELVTINKPDGSNAEYVCGTLAMIFDKEYEKGIRDGLTQH
jgi:hypothetical protein